MYKFIQSSLQKIDDENEESKNNESLMEEEQLELSTPKKDSNVISTIKFSDSASAEENNLATTIKKPLVLPN